MCFLTSISRSFLLSSFLLFIPSSQQYSFSLFIPLSGFLVFHLYNILSFLIDMTSLFSFSVFVHLWWLKMVFFFFVANIRFFLLFLLAYLHTHGTCLSHLVILYRLHHFSSFPSSRYCSFLSLLLIVLIFTLFCSFIQTTYIVPSKCSRENLAFYVFLNFRFPTGLVSLSSLDFILAKTEIFHHF